MNSRVKGLKECHKAIISAFERVDRLLSEAANVEHVSAETVEPILDSVCEAKADLNFYPVEKTLGWFAQAYAAIYRESVDGQHHSVHEVLYASVEAAALAIYRRLESSPDDWQAALKAFVGQGAAYRRIREFQRHHRNLWRHELEDAINDALGRLTPAAVKRPDPFTSKRSPTEEFRLADVFEVDIAESRVRYRSNWYPVTGEGARLCEELLKRYPDWYVASKDFTKPSRTKSELPAAIRELIESVPGKGYRLVIAPEAPELRRKLPASAAR